MSQVPARIEHITLTGDYEDADGNPVLIESIRAQCLRCRNFTEIYGDSEDSVLRGLATLRDTCPNGKRNFYTAVHGG